MDCFICRKHAGEIASPPGGWVYEDKHWRVCHAPIAMAVSGQLLVESRRHFLDFAEMTPEEGASYGPLLARIVAALKGVTGAERIYMLVTLEGAAHFHAWLVPRTPDIIARGVAFLAEDHACAEEEALEVVRQMQHVLR